MFAIVVIIAIIVLCCANLTGQALAIHNFEQEQQKFARQMDADFTQRQRDMAADADIYFNPVMKTTVPWFYSDGSLKRDPITDSTFKKGQYRVTSNGLDCNLKQAPPGAKRPPGK